MNVIQIVINSMLINRNWNFTLAKYIEINFNTIVVVADKQQELGIEIAVVFFFIMGWVFISMRMGNKHSQNNSSSVELNLFNKKLNLYK